MPITALSVTDLTRYVSNLDPAKGTPTQDAEATVFMLGALTPRQRAQVNDATIKWGKPAESEDEVQSYEVLISERMFLIVKYGLRGWERMQDADGNEVPFKATKKMLGGVSVACASDAAMNCLSTPLIAELAAKVEELSTPKAEALKG